MRRTSRGRNWLRLLMIAAILAGATSRAWAQDYLIESYRRQDFTGAGSFHRLGLLREQQESVEASPATDGKPTGAESNLATIADIFSFDGKANSMVFGSSNIFNQEIDEEASGQYAEFLGAAVNAEFGPIIFTSSYDHAWFLNLEKKNDDSDFFTSTTRQQMRAEHSFFGDKFSVGIPVFAQNSVLSNRKSGMRVIDLWTYGSNVEFSWTPTPWAIPTFSYNYSYQDADGPGSPADKHKHDFNLGTTFIPIKNVKLFVSPSVQYSHEQFTSQGRKDNAWTPTISATYQPFKFLACDAIGSYTDSKSNIEGASFDAIVGTFFLRLFVHW